MLGGKILLTTGFKCWLFFSGPLLHIGASLRTVFCCWRFDCGFHRDIYINFVNKRQQLETWKRESKRLLKYAVSVEVEVEVEGSTWVELGGTTPHCTSNSTRTSGRLGRFGREELAKLPSLKSKHCWGGAGSSSPSALLSILPTGLQISITLPFQWLEVNSFWGRPLIDMNLATMLHKLYFDLYVTCSWSYAVEEKSTFHSLEVEVVLTVSGHQTLVLRF